MDSMLRLVVRARLVLHHLLELDLLLEVGVPFWRAMHLCLRLRLQFCHCLWSGNVPAAKTSNT